MSIEHLIQVRCGVAHCGGRFGPLLAPHWWVVRQAEARGWRLASDGTTKIDLCPEHRAQEQRWNGITPTPRRKR